MQQIIPGEFSINIIQRDFGALCAMTLQSDLPSWTFANPLPVTPKMCKVGTHSAQGSWVWATWSSQRNIEGGPNAEET